ncbi:uncharacterized protein LOC126265567 [Aethina tumida]|uniref:uncharacterized protein LOC126265567 n=1 Tax=Aethina tumida TaxID=116153 RepID=UPI0021491309|nr:uncharacterized protein LOC126265567 [Aethina tumida]
MRDFVENHPVLATSPMNPRDGFYGGRTGNTVTYYKCNKGERIKYIDECSLYPFVFKYGRFPLGHPTIHVGSAAQDTDLSTVDGMVKCKILPPTQLYHPVLPVRMKGKLMFALCNSCGESSQQRECCHTEEERSFTGTWVIAEVLKALEEGNRIGEVFELWTYETRQYNHAAGQPGLFTEMMNKFIKIKQEASGWPTDCVNDVVKQQQYPDFEEDEKVKLTPKRIENNPYLRSLAKLMPNSFWGKCGQRENQPQTTIINDPQECFDFLAHPSKNVNSITPVNEQTVVINWEYADEAVESLPTVNVVIAAFVTAQARLKLYEYLEMLDTRVLYYDTDSVIYVSNNLFPDPLTGKFIGDMTDELEVYGIVSTSRNLFRANRKITHTLCGQRQSNVSNMFVR